MLHLAAAFVERRAAKRVNLDLRTRLLHRGLQHADIVVRDLSFTGFNGETDAPVGEGDLVSIGLPRIGLVRAQSNGGAATASPAASTTLSTSAPVSETLPPKA